MSENRSCQEFIPKPVIPSNYEEPTAPHVNCANCKRWNIDEKKCHEMIWVKDWVEYTAEEDLPIASGWCQY